MSEPKLEEFVEPVEQIESVKVNPLTFIKGGLLETEEQISKELTQEDMVSLEKQIKEIRTDLQVFAEDVEKVESMEKSYSDLPFLTTLEEVSLEKQNYQDLNREERNALCMSVNRSSILVNRKNYEILSRYVERLESLLADSSN